MEKSCPRCGAANMADAVQCLCGWNFFTPPPLGYASPQVAEYDPKVAGWAKASWICPLIAWVSQCVINGAFRGMHGVIFLLLAALFQFGLLVGGLCLGIRVLVKGRAAVAPSTWWSAVVGVVLSGGTFLLIAVIIVCAVLLL